MTDINIHLSTDNIATFNFDLTKEEFNRFLLTMHEIGRCPLCLMRGCNQSVYDRILEVEDCGLKGIKLLDRDQLVTSRDVEEECIRRYSDKDAYGVVKAHTDEDGTQHFLLAKATLDSIILQEVTVRNVSNITTKPCQVITDINAVRQRYHAALNANIISAMTMHSVDFPTSPAADDVDISKDFVFCPLVISERKHLTNTKEICVPITKRQFEKKVKAYTFDVMDIGRYSINDCSRGNTNSMERFLEEINAGTISNLLLWANNDIMDWIGDIRLDALIERILGNGMNWEVLGFHNEWPAPLCERIQEEMKVTHAKYLKLFMPEYTGKESCCTVTPAEIPESLSCISKDLAVVYPILVSTTDGHEIMGLLTEEEIKDLSASTLLTVKYVSSVPYIAIWCSSHHADPEWKEILDMYISFADLEWILPVYKEHHHGPTLIAELKKQRPDTIERILAQCPYFDEYSLRDTIEDLARGDIGF